MKRFVIYHNPRCSKSRAVLEILRTHQIESRMVEYLKTPLDAKSIRELLGKLGLRPRDILREGEEEFSRLHLDDPAKTDDELIDAIAKHPILLQRPIVVHGRHAVVGRPPEKVMELITKRPL
jgi:arsenate reductase